MEIGQDSNINASSNFFEEDETKTGLDGYSYNYTFDGIGEGILVPIPLNIEETTPTDAVQSVDEVNITSNSLAQDRDDGSTDNLTGTTGSTGSTDLTPVDNSNSEQVSQQVDAATAKRDETNSMKASSEIVSDWSGGYKLEIDLTATSEINNWAIDFELPYEISEVYNVDLTDNQDGSYTISGESGQENLAAGDSIKPVLIVNDNGEDAIAPEFSSGTEAAETEPRVSPTPDNTDNPEEDITAKPDATGEIINVDRDFAGNLDEAISAANDGDIVQLGATTYYTTGITFNKNITIDGEEGTIIDGGGTSETIFSMYSGASGATIQDLEITNGNTGIFVSEATDVTLQNLDINNMGISETIRVGPNNSGIHLDRADRFQVLDSNIYDIGRKGVGINNTDGGTVSGLKIQNVNLAAQHAQSFDAGGIKLFNTNEILIQDNYLSDINGFMIWNDTTNATIIEDNAVINAGEDFQAPDFNNNVYMAGIYNEKSSNAVVRGNEATSMPNFFAFRATEFSTETMTLGENNFSDFEVNTTDYWVNEKAEKLIALTEDPDEATFDLISQEFFDQANIGDENNS